MTSAIIASAGSVFGEDERKSTDNIGETSSIRRIIMAFRQAGIKTIVVVTGFDADVLERHCSHMGVIFLRNNAYDSGDMLSSVKIGISYLKDKCEKAFISPAYVPFFSAETVKSMASMTEPVVIPMCNNKTGHPLLLSANLFDRVLEYDGSGGLEDALSGEDVARRFLDVSDEGILIHTRDRSNANAVTENQSLRKIRPDARIRLMGEKPFFGPGTLHLLNLTHETGSLSQAAQQMGISYSKAWKMVAAAEKQLDSKLIISKQGGRAGGGSEITKDGLEFMKRYEAFLTECSEFIDASFENHFR
jgi:molybdate transport repressor ModE-like protein